MCRRSYAKEGRDNWKNCFRVIELCLQGRQICMESGDYFAEAWIKLHVGWLELIHLVSCQADYRFHLAEIFCDDFDIRHGQASCTCIQGILEPGKAGGEDSAAGYSWLRSFDSKRQEA